MIRACMRLIVGLAVATLWLLLLEVTNFSPTVIGMGLLAALAVLK